MAAIESNFEKVINPGRFRLVGDVTPGADRPAWEGKIAAEAMRFTELTGKGFVAALLRTLGDLPDINDPHQKLTQLNYFLQALVGLTVQQVAELYGYDEATENLIIDSMKDKFTFIREQDKLRKEAETAAEALKPS
jgi:hypothetical protein